MIEFCWLVRNGIGEDFALSLGAGERLGMAIVFASFHGKEYDFEKRTFYTPES
jgi:hypothetical protein